MHKIRKIHRNVFILFIQDSFYFSDYVVCLYFGWSGMKECSERIDITSGLNLITYISSNEYMQVYACPRVIDKEEKEEDTICNIRSFLYDRLSWIVDSKTQRHIIIESANRERVHEISKRLGVSSQLIYRYKFKMNNIFNLKKSNELIYSFELMISELTD